MDEAVLALLGTLVEIRQELGDAVYGSALDRARIAIAAEVLVEAERRALRVRRQAPPQSSEGNVVILRPRSGTCSGITSHRPPSDEIG